MLHVKQ